MAGKKGVNPFAKMKKGAKDDDAKMSKKALGADIKADKKLYGKKKK